MKSNGVVKSKTGPKTRQYCQNVWQDANNRHPENQEERYEKLKPMQSRRQKVTHEIIGKQRM